MIGKLYIKTGVLQFFGDSEVKGGGYMPEILTRHVLIFWGGGGTENIVS